MKKVNKRERKKSRSSTCFAFKLALRSFRVEWFDQKRRAFKEAWFLEQGEGALEHRLRLEQHDYLFFPPEFRLTCCLLFSKGICYEGNHSAAPLGLLFRALGRSGDPKRTSSVVLRQRPI